MKRTKKELEKTDMGGGKLESGLKRWIGALRRKRTRSGNDKKVKWKSRYPLSRFNPDG